MRKYILIIMLITIMGTVLFGCKNDKSSQLNDTGDPESYFEYGCDGADGLFSDHNYYNPDMLLPIPDRDRTADRHRHFSRRA